MRDLFAIILLIFLILVVIGIGFSFYIFNGSEAVVNGEYSVRPERIEVPTDSAAVAHGRHIAVTRGCTGCHGADLGGMINDMQPLGTFVGSNLTQGEGGVGEKFRAVDWIRAIRHGIGDNRNLLLMMPAEEYYYLSDSDLGDLIAYLQQLPPVDRELPPSTIGVVGRMLIQFEAMKTLTSARYIDHRAARPEAPQPSATAEYGEYLAVSCTGCHGPDMAGNVNLGPQAPRATNINPYGLGLAGYSKDTFIRAMRLGLKPDGEQMDPFMPWDQMGQMTDLELEALYMYLRSLPAVEADS